MESEDRLKATNHCHHYTKGGLDMIIYPLFLGSIILAALDAIIVTVNIHVYIKTKKFSYLFFAVLISFVFLAAVVR